MTTEQLHARYPGLFARLEDTDILLRHLVVVDENEKDVTDDDIMDELYDPDTYSHVAYIYPVVAEAAGEAFATIPARLMAQHEAIRECFASEPDQWGLVTTLDEEAIALAILDAVEQLIGETEGERDA